MLSMYGDPTHRAGVNAARDPLCPERPGRRVGALVAHDGFGLDLHFPAGVEEPGHDHHGGRRSDVAEDSSMDATDGVGIGPAGEEHPGPQATGELSAGLGYGGGQDLA